MPTIYFLRRGQTDFSREDQLCGTTDPPLNAVGLEMARIVGERCAKQAWMGLYASPLLRTRQTAAAIGERIGRTAELVAGVREIDYGTWEALAVDDVKRRWPAEYGAWDAHPAKVPPPGGETAAQIAARAVPAVEEIVRRHPEGDVLVVSHKATIRVIVCALIGIDLDEFRRRIAAPVASLSAIEFKRTGPLLVLLGDTSHFPDHLTHLRGT